MYVYVYLPVHIAKKLLNFRLLQLQRWQLATACLLLLCITYFIDKRLLLFMVAKWEIFNLAPNSLICLAIIYIIPVCLYVFVCICVYLVHFSANIIVLFRLAIFLLFVVGQRKVPLPWIMIEWLSSSTFCSIFFPLFILIFTPRLTPCRPLFTPIRWMLIAQHCCCCCWHYYRCD